MKQFKSLLTLSLLAGLFMLNACGDDEPEPEVNRAPTITSQSFSVSEAATAADVFATVAATDPDGDELSFSMVATNSHPFTITADGKLSLGAGKSLDFETTTNYTITVNVTDGQLDDSKDITVTVIDVDENTSPVIAEQSFTVAEDIDAAIIIGTVTATDAEGDNLSYSITTDESGLFEITASGELSLIAGKSLDFETAQTHAISVQVSDGSLSSTATMTVNVTDIYENEAPAISDQSFTIGENVDAATVIGTVAATDVEAVTFSITNNASGKFEITTGGKLSLKEGESLDYETATSHAITVQATDGDLSSTATITVNVTDVNEAPIIEDQSFEVAEDVDDAFIIGTISATDGEGDNLTYSLITDNSGLFELATTGEISLIGGQSLDYETGKSYTINVQVSDGSFSRTATVTINVTDIVIESDGFVTSWTTDASITIPTNPSYTYNYTVDWGDGTEVSGITGDASHTYTSAGTYIVSITGDFPAIYFNDVGDKDNIQEVLQWGAIQWKSMEGAFHGCMNLNTSATDTPDLNMVSSMARMFKGVSRGVLNGSFETWNVSNVTDMTSLFNATSFNKDISNWDVSNVTTMEEMFRDNGKFNQDISSWNMSSVTNIASMFSRTFAFNQSLNGWDVSNVTNMSFVFNTTVAFNQDISMWNVSNVTDMYAMFANAQKFNQDLSSWNVNRVTQCAFFSTNAIRWSKAKPTFTSCTP